MAVEGWKQRLRSVRSDVYALALAYVIRASPGTRRGIPVVGYGEDVLILPIGILLVRRMIPCAILGEHRPTAAFMGLCVALR